MEEGRNDPSPLPRSPPSSTTTDTTTTTTAPSPSPPPTTAPKTKRRAPRPYIIINNISKPSNVKSLLQSAAAFGCRTIFVGGQKKFNFDPSPSPSPSSTSNGISGIPPLLKNLISSGQITIVRFDKLQECIDHVHSLGIKVIGIEIDETSCDVEDYYNNTSSDETEKGMVEDTAFMMGNEGQGMNEKQMAVCDGFVKISQYGGGTASLNVSVAASIVLQRFYQRTLEIRNAGGLY